VSCGETLECWIDGVMERWVIGFPNAREKLTQEKFLKLCDTVFDILDQLDTLRGLK
jgi:hypothetical protein